MLEKTVKKHKRKLHYIQKELTVKRIYGKPYPEWKPYQHL